MYLDPGQQPPQVEIVRGPRHDGSAQTQTLRLHRGMGGCAAQSPAPRDNIPRYVTYCQEIGCSHVTAGVRPSRSAPVRA